MDEIIILEVSIRLSFKMIFNRTIKIYRMFYKNNDSLDQYQFWIEIFLSIWPMLESDSQEYN